MENIVCGFRKLSLRNLDESSAALVKQHICKQKLGVESHLSLSCLIADTIAQFQINRMTPDLNGIKNLDKNFEINSDASSINECDDDVGEVCGKQPRSKSGLRRLSTRPIACTFPVIKNTIMKPKKRDSCATEFKMATTFAQFKKIYMNKKLTKFNPSNLETIFEETEEKAHIDLENNYSIKMGNKKMRRSISLENGLNTNKTTIRKRRTKIKKVFGRRHIIKKISMNEFQERLNKSFNVAMATAENPIITERKASANASITLKDDLKDDQMI